MAEKNYRTVAVVPEMPRTIDTQQLHVYTPVGSVNNFGVFKPDGQQFVITADGKLRVDASKLIQLNEPAATVVEDGGVTGVDVNFTEADSTLMRKFSFVFKNIKGATGDKGNAGQDALQSNYTWSSVNQPVVDTVGGTVFSAFNRTPVVGDMFISAYKYTDIDLKTILGVYIVNCEITEVAEVTSTCNFKITSFLQIPIKYIKEITGPVTSGLEDTYTIVFSDGTAHNFVVTNGATGAQGPAGATGAQGEQGPKGDDGVSITSVTQTGIDGGTRVTITLSDGQTTSFDVMNGINTNFQVVDVLPTENISTSTIYLVPSTTPGEENIYDEYIYVNGNWEHIGSTSVDLSDYVTKTYFNQNVGDATKNYVVAQMSKIQNLYIEMYESGSVPVKGQALTLTNSNFARVPAQGQYFALIELVNTKDKYYSICKIASVDTTTCSATVEAVTELDNGTEIEAIKQSIAALTTTVEGKQNKLQTLEITSPNGVLTPAQYAVLASDRHVQLWYRESGDSANNLYVFTFCGYDSSQTAEIYMCVDNVRGDSTTDVRLFYVNPATRVYGIKVVYSLETQHNKQDLPRDDLLNSSELYPSYRGLGLYTSTYCDSKKATVTLTATSGSITADEYNKLKADNRSYIVTSTGRVLYYVETTNNVLGYAAMYEDGLTVVTINSDYTYAEQIVDVGGEAYHIELADSASGSKLTEEQYNALKADDNSYILLANGPTFRLTRVLTTANGVMQYQNLTGNVVRSVSITDARVWTFSTQIVELTDYKTTTLNSSSTNTQYPSAKATYAYGQTVLTDAKAYADSILGAEQVWLQKITTGEGV